MKKLGSKLLVDFVVNEQVLGSSFAVIPQTRRSTRGASRQPTSNGTNDYSTSNKIIIPKNIITLTNKNDSSSNIPTAKTRGRKKKIRLLDPVDKDESYQNQQQLSLEDSQNQRLSNKMETSSSDKALKITKISLSHKRVNETNDDNEDDSLPNDDYQQFNEELEDQEEEFEEDYYSQSNNSNSMNFRLQKHSQNGTESMNQYSEDYESNFGKKLTKRQKNIMMKNNNQVVVTEEINDFEEPLLSLPEKRRKARKNKKVLTEEEQIKKLQMEEKRKQQFKKMNEQKRQQVVDQILNESGRQKIKRNKEELQKDIEKQTHKFRSLPSNDIKIKFISTPQGEQLAIDKKLAGVDILKPIDPLDEKIQYNIIAHAAALNNNNGYTHSNSYTYSPNITSIHSNGVSNGINTTIYSNDELTKQIELQKKIMCSYCNAKQFKYKIPKTKLVACSLECFKLLKL